MSEPVVVVPRFERRRVAHPGGGELKTKQSDAADSDINVIMSKWLEHGVVRGTLREPRYGDFSAGIDYLEYRTKLMEAESEFMALPSEVRKICDNDVGVFLDALNDENALKELLDLGLDPEYVPPKEEPEPGGEGGPPTPPASSETGSPPVPEGGATG